MAPENVKHLTGEIGFCHIMLSLLLNQFNRTLWHSTLTSIKYLFIKNQLGCIASQSSRLVLEQNQLSRKGPPPGLWNSDPEDDLILVCFHSVKSSSSFFHKVQLKEQQQKGMNASFTIFL